MPHHIRFVEGSQRLELAKEAGKAGVKLDCHELLGCFHDEQLVAVAGLDLRQGNKAYFRSAYVRPAWRKRGLYRALFRARLEICRRRGHKAVYAACNASSLPVFLKAGAVVVRRIGRWTHVRLEIGGSECQG